jgi:hypothetical protein
MTSDCSDAPGFRVTVDPKATNGLRVSLQVMADKPATIRRERIGHPTSQLEDQDFDRLRARLWGLTRRALDLRISCGRNFCVSLIRVNIARNRLPGTTSS